ncbi:MAG: neutral/alkaline non-lysosomal ceramidase N-terminal domain-containing protein [Myxococcales bacterium]
MKAERADGLLLAGAAKVELAPELPVVIAGYPPPRREASDERAPLYARAIVLRSGQTRVGLVSLELLEMPESLVDRVRERAPSLGLDGVIVTATHVHSSFGGYDPRLLPAVAATGAFDEELASHLVAKVEACLRLAADAVRAVSARAAAIAVPGVTRNRAEPGARVDDRLRVLALDAVDGGAPVARLLIFAAHPTLVARGGERLDGDFPGRLMASLEEEGGVAVFTQGAVGDVSARTREPEEVALALAKAVRDALAAARPPLLEPSLGFAEVQVELPRALAPSSVPGALRRPVSNLLAPLLPRTARVAILRLGELSWLFVPGEPTTFGAAQVLGRIGAPAGVPEPILVGLSQGYLGYIEASDRVLRSRGEARRALFEASLVERLAEGLAAAAEALDKIEAGAATSSAD